MNNKIVFITGANKGIGKAIMQRFCESGIFTLIAHSRRDSNGFQEMIEKYRSIYKVEIHTVFFDLRNYQIMSEEILELKRKIEHIDVLVNNAAVAHGGLFQMTAIDEIKAIFDVNLFSTMKLTQLILRFMKKNTEASIINISSISSFDLSRGNCAYGVSKAALNAFTINLSKELGSLGIRVNAVAPGLVDTEMATLMDQKSYTDMINHSLLGRLGKTSEIANLVYYLASSEASFINGQIIRCDGGRI